MIKNHKFVAKDNIIMKKLNYKELKNSDRVIYSYIRGSYAYGLEKPDGTSDIDTALVFIEPNEQLLGLGLDYQEQISDEKNDNVGYSLKKYMNMLLTSNPTALESLFIPDRCILYEHPIMTEIKKHRDKFITKVCFKPFLGYSYQQIAKCRGLNKKIVNPITERKEPLDFVYTFFRQGSTKIENWLEHRALHQKYCGLVNIPNMDMTMGVYYDWGRYFEDLRNEGITLEKIIKIHETYVNSEENTAYLGKMLKEGKEKNISSKEFAEIADRLKDNQFCNMYNFICEFYHLKTPLDFKSWYAHQLPIGYKGMVGEDKLSNELRLSSVSKGEKPICYIYYNKNGYSQHCREYKEYKEWEKNRNPERYKENCGKQFDRKNVAHAVRLLHMGIEIAKGEGFNVDRTNIDRDFIMNIRLGNTSYEEIISYIEGKKDEMEILMKSSTLPDKIDENFVNDLLVDIRKKQLGLK